MSRQERARLFSLPLQYIEARHRLGLVDEDFKKQAVEARALVREALGALEGAVEFYDPDKVCAAAPVRDNLLFGRISHRIAKAQARVGEALAATLNEVGLVEEIETLGLDRQVGTAGRLLSAQERASVNLVRCLVKHPDILVVDGALSPFDETRARGMARLLIDTLKGRSLFMVASSQSQTEGFDIVMRFENGGVMTEACAAPAEKPEGGPRRLAGGIA